MIITPLLNETPDSEKIDLAQPVAIAFLQMIDAGQYGQSWQSASRLMQERVSQQAWEEKLKDARTRSGQLVSRDRTSATYSTEAQDSPEGEYIMLIYDSRFEHAEDVSEYVTVMRDGEDWKVAGYFMED
jgi:hypothetical protein